MTNALNTIMNALSSHFSAYDEQYVARMVKWGLHRKAAVMEFKKSPEYLMYVYKKYDKLHAMCGGKTWYHIVNDNTVSMLEKLIEDICKDNIDERNAKIARKIQTIGASEVVGEGKVTTCADGFNGVFFVNTDLGQKRVEINTILAGGYDVQCLHYRTLIKVK